MDAEPEDLEPAAPPEAATGPGGIPLPGVPGFLIFVGCAFGYLFASMLLVGPLGVLWSGLAAQFLFFGVLPLGALRLLGTGRRHVYVALPVKGTRALAVFLVPLLVLLFFQYEMVQETYLYRSQDELRRFYEETFDTTSAAPALLFLSVAVFPALCEEFLFRGVLLGSLRTGLGAAPAVAVSAALFAAVHPLPSVLLPIFILGIALGTLTVVTGSVLPGVAVHFLNNFVVVLFLLREDAARAVERLFPMRLYAFAILLGAVILLLVAARVRARRLAAE